MTSGTPFDFGPVFKDQALNKVSDIQQFHFF